MRAVRKYPPRSPELNAIKYCWAHMENILRWSTEVPDIPTRVEAEALVRSAWDVATKAAFMKTQTQRVWENIQKVIAAKGDNRFVETPFRIPALYRK